MPLVLTCNNVKKKKKKKHGKASRMVNSGLVLHLWNTVHISNFSTTQRRLLLCSLMNAVVEFSSYCPNLPVTNTHKLPHSHPLNTCQPSHTHTHTHVLCKCVRKDTIRWFSYSHQSCRRFQAMCVDISKKQSCPMRGHTTARRELIIVTMWTPFS